MTDERLAEMERNLAAALPAAAIADHVVRDALDSATAAARELAAEVRRLRAAEAGERMLRARVARLEALLDEARLLLDDSYAAAMLIERINAATGA